MTRKIVVCLPLVLAAVVSASCGSSSPTQPSSTPRATAFGIINGNSGLPDIVLGPDDSLPIVGLANLGPSGTAIPVTDQMRLESSNRSVLTVEGTNVVGVTPGEADIRATFQSLTATAHARVFPPSAVAGLVIGGGEAQYTCSLNDQVDFVVVATLDDGTELRKMSVVWRSSTPTVARIDIYGRLTCTSPGQATIEVSYQGKTASKQIIVRAPQAARRLGGSSSADQS